MDDADEPNPASPHHHTTSDDRLVLLCGHLKEKSRARPRLHNAIIFETESY